VDLVFTAGGAAKALEKLAAEGNPPFVMQAQVRAQGSTGDGAPAAAAEEVLGELASSMSVGTDRSEKAPAAAAPAAQKQRISEGAQESHAFPEMRNSEWRISKGRKGSIPDRFRKGGEMTSAAAPKDKPEGKAALPTAEKTKAAVPAGKPPAAADKAPTADKPAEKTTEKPAPKVTIEDAPPAAAKTAEYPWKRGKRDVKPAEVVEERRNEPVDEFEDLPVTDLLGWLESHAPKDFLEVHLRQICEEVELMQA
jgi:hypothetical protein